MALICSEIPCLILQNVFGTLFSYSSTIKKETRSRQIGCTCCQEMSPYTSRKLCDVQTQTSQRSSTAQQYVVSCWNQRSHGRYQYGVTLRVKTQSPHGHWSGVTVTKCQFNIRKSTVTLTANILHHSLMLLSNSDVVSNAIHKDHLHFKTAYFV